MITAMILEENIMKKWILLFAAAVALLGFSGCKAKQKEKTVTVLEITSDQKETEISIGGKAYGKAPLSGKFTPGIYVICAEKEGYDPVWKSVTVEKGKKTKVDFKLSRMKSAILLQTKPNIKADVIFKGNKIGQTPIVISDLECGTYSAEVKAPGYSAAHAKWTIDTKRPKKVSVQIKENTGVIRVNNVSAKNAMVKLNGKNYGTLPRDFRLEQGEYMIEVSAPGYAPYSQKVALVSGKKVVVRPVLSELPGKLIIKSNPAGALVTMNGKRYGTTPITLEGIKPGRISITLSKQNYDPVTINNLGVAAGKTVSVSRNLISSLGSVEFVTVPAGVTVYLDNKLLTVTEKDPRSKGYSKVFRVGGLRPGKHTLKFTHKRAKPKEKKVDFVVEKNKNFRIPGVVEMWIPNAQITLKVGSKYEGRIVRESKTSITFEQSRRSRLDYNRSELEKIEWLAEEE